MKLRCLASVLCVLLLPSIAVHSEAAPAVSITPFLGYGAQAAVAEGDWEKKFREGISPDAIRENMRRLSARPHNVGSAYDKDNAEWILAQFKSWGFDAKIETFDVLFPTPKVRVLDLLQPTPFHASLQEPVVAVDPTSGQTSEQLPIHVTCRPLTERRDACGSGA